MGYRKKIASCVGHCELVLKGFELLHRSPRIVFYHGVEDKILYNAKVQANQMSFHDFEKQIRYLSQNYNIVSIDAFFERCRNHQETSRDIVITFDDGYKNNCTVVAPLLESLSVPFTVFVSAGLIEEGRRIPTFTVRSAVYHEGLDRLCLSSMAKEYDLSSSEKRDKANKEIIDYIKTSSNDVVKQVIAEIQDNLSNEQKQEIEDLYTSEDLMSWDDVRKISKMGATIGSHCMDHAILHKNQPKQEIESQLINSKALIEKNVGRCDYFSFPNGSMDSVCPLAIGLARKIYKLSFVVDGKSVVNSFDSAQISRIGACENFYAFKSQLSILSLW